jgi:hypothetical protein
LIGDTVEPERTQGLASRRKKIASKNGPTMEVAKEGMEWEALV